MLAPAQLYEGELRNKFATTLYDEKYKWYSGWTGCAIPHIPDNTYEGRDFVSLNEEGEVIGYISYRFNMTCMRAHDFGIICFEDCSVVFAKDVFQCFVDIFEKYNLKSARWDVIVGNPAIRGYKHFIEKHGGRICGYYRQCTRLMDGKIYDSMSFEVLAEEFHK